MAEKHRKRKEQFKVNLYPEEKDILEQKSAQAGMTKTDYVRNVILFGSAREKSNFTREDAEKILYEVNRIGNNINQIAYQANSSRTLDQAEFLSLKDQFVHFLAMFEKFVIS